MRRIDPRNGELGEMSPSERTAELRFINTRGETEAWIIACSPGDLGMFRDSVSQAYIDPHVDSRIGRQMEIIERLMRVIKAHGLEEEARTA